MAASSITELVAGIPFISASGIDLVAAGPGWAITALDQEARHTSHAGTFQGAVTYSVAEAASSLVIAGIVEDPDPGMTFAIFNASVSYQRPVSGRVVANAALAEPIDRVRARLHRDRAVSLAVIVRLSDADGSDVGRAEFGCRIVLPAGELAAGARGDARKTALYP